MVECTCVGQATGEHDEYCPLSPLYWGTHYTIKLEDALHMVGKGWSELVKKCYELCDNDEIVKATGYYFVTNVKEKYGGLRFYVDGISDVTFNKIEEICDTSYKVCENCGKPGKTREDGHGWYITSCDECW